MTSGPRARAGDDPDDGYGDRGSGTVRAARPLPLGLRHTPDERIRRTHAAWLLWCHPTTGSTGILAAWQSLSPRERNAWRIAVASARDEVPPELEPE